MILKRGNYADTLAVNYAESHFSAWSAANVVFDVCSSTNQARMKGGIYDGDFLCFLVFSVEICVYSPVEVFTKGTKHLLMDPGAASVPSWR